MSRNNVLQVRKAGGSSIRDASKSPDPEYDYDYDLLSGKVVSAGPKKNRMASKACRSTPQSVPPSDYSLDPGSLGFDAGVVIPNFNDGYAGKAPDIGAFEAGAPPMEFGVKAKSNP